MDEEIKSILNGIFEASINEDKKNWKLKGTISGYQERIKELSDKIDLLKESNKTIEAEIKYTAEQNEILTNLLEQSKFSLSVNYQSYLLLQLHEECETNRIKECNERSNKIMTNWNLELERRRQWFQNSNPTYKVLIDKKVELKKTLFNIKKIEHDIQEMKKKEKLKLEIRQKRFYAYCVDLAQSWLNKKKYEDSLKKLEELEIKEKYLINEMVELDEAIKEKQRSNAVKKSMQNNSVTYNTLKKLNFSMMFNSPNAVRKQNQPTPIFNSLDENPPLTLSQSQNAPSKILVLENKVIAETKQSKSHEVDKKSLKLHSKLCKLMQNFQGRRQLSRSFSKSRENSFKNNTQKTDNQEKVDKMETTPGLVPNKQTESETTHPVQNLNISLNISLSSSILSQEPEKNLEEFQYDPEVQTDEKRKTEDNELKISSQQEKIFKSDNILSTKEQLHETIMSFFKPPEPFKQKSSNPKDVFTSGYFKQNNEDAISTVAKTSGGIALQTNSEIKNNQDEKVDKSGTISFKKDLFVPPQDVNQSQFAPTKIYSNQQENKNINNANSKFQCSLESDQSGNQFKEEKADDNLSGPSGSTNFAMSTQNNNDAFLKNTGMDFNFGNITQFINNSETLNYPFEMTLSPSGMEPISDVEMPFSGTDFAFGQTFDAFNFHFQNGK